MRSALSFVVSVSGGNDIEMLYNVYQMSNPNTCLRPDLCRYCIIAIGLMRSTKKAILFPKMSQSAVFMRNREVFTFTRMTYQNSVGEDTLKTEQIQILE